MSIGFIVILFTGRLRLLGFIEFNDEGFSDLGFQSLGVYGFRLS